MGRLVQAARLERVPLRRGMLESADTAVVPVGGDDYRDRIAKYIPGEVLAAYMSIDSMVAAKVEAVKEGAKRAKPALESAVDPAAAGSASVPHSVSPALLVIIQNLPIAVLLVGLIFTPLYIRQIALRGGPGTPWRTQAVVSTLAFLVWAYAFQGGVFGEKIGFNLYDGTLAAAMLAVFTLASGLFSPSPANSDGQG